MYHLLLSQRCCIQSVPLYGFPGPPSAPSGNDPHWMHAPALRRQPWVPLPPLSELWLVEDLEPQLVPRIMSLPEQFGCV
jgi:hypothetical protein